MQQFRYGCVLRDSKGAAIELFAGLPSTETSKRVYAILHGLDSPKHRSWIRRFLPQVHGETLVVEAGTDLGVYLEVTAFVSPQFLETAEMKFQRWLMNINYSDFTINVAYNMKQLHAKAEEVGLKFRGHGKHQTNNRKFLYDTAKSIADEILRRRELDGKA